MIHIAYIPAIDVDSCKVGTFGRMSNCPYSCTVWGFLRCSSSGCLQAAPDLWSLEVRLANYNDQDFTESGYWYSTQGEVFKDSKIQDSSSVWLQPLSHVASEWADLRFSVPATASRGGDPPEKTIDLTKYSHEGSRTLTED